MDIALLNVALATLGIVLAVLALIRVDNVLDDMPSDSKLRTLSSEFHDSLIRLDSLETQLRRMRSKYAMRDRRDNEEQPTSDIPDSTSDPAGYKKAMRIKLAAGGTLRSNTFKHEG